MTPRSTTRIGAAARGGGPTPGQRIPPPGPSATFARLLSDLEREGVRIESTLEAARGGARLSTMELLTLQARIHDFSVGVEAVSAAVNRLVSAIKTTMSPQG